MSAGERQFPGDAWGGHGQSTRLLMNCELVRQSAGTHDVLPSVVNECIIAKSLNGELQTKTLAADKSQGRGLYGRGRGHNKGTITVAIRASKRQKEPSIALIFYKLPLSCALSRQRSRVRAPSSPPELQLRIARLG
jgi:hypothetical protein